MRIGVPFEIVFRGIKHGFLLAQHGNDVFLRGRDETDHPVAEEGNIGTVQRMLYFIKSLVILPLRFGDGRA